MKAIDELNLVHLVISIKAVQDLFEAGNFLYEPVHSIWKFLRVDKQTILDVLLFLFFKACKDNVIRF